MKKNVLAMLALSFGLSMSFSSCNDTCVDAGGNGNGDGEALNDAEYQKKLTLNCLLGAVAGVDSLPDNWNTSSYRLSIDDNTIGFAADDANPGVRNVVATSADEAYRKFVNLTGSSNSGSTPETETWTKDGIGSLNFKQAHETDLYATVDVNIEQMPGLTQIRYVPASAVGHNASFSGTPYYQFGDIILQTKEGEEPTYWICVRPASKIAGVETTHWCTFQLNSVDKSNPNYKKLTSRKYQDVTVPTDLGTPQEKAALNVQNLFNVLRIIASPALYENQGGIDDITSKEFETYQVKAINYMWEDKGIWDLIKNKNYSNSTSLKTYLTSANPVIDAFYYGYTKSMFSDYATVFNTELSVNKSGSNTLFNKATNTSPKVEFGVNQAKNFADFETGSAIFKLSSEESEARGPYQFVIKYRKGAQLQGRIGAKFLDDSDPTKSFEETAKSTEKIKDILVSRKLIESKTEQTGPFYAFGDKVTDSKVFTGNQFCIKETNSKSNFTDAEEKKTFFLTSSSGKVNTDKGGTESGEKISEDLAKNILYHLMNAYVYNETNNKSVALDISGNYTTQYHNSLKELYTLFGKDSGIDFSKTQITTGSGSTATATGNYIYTVKVRFYMDNDDIDSNGKMSTPVTVTLTYDTSKKSDKTKGFTYAIDRSNPGKTTFLRVYKYQDNYTYQETYSKTCEFGITGAARTYIKNNLYTSVNTFLNYLKQQQ